MRDRTRAQAKGRRSLWRKSACGHLSVAPNGALEEEAGAHVLQGEGCLVSRGTRAGYEKFYYHCCRQLDTTPFTLSPTLLQHAQVARALF